jgi:hypothetical protein
MNGFKPSFFLNIIFCFFINTFCLVNVYSQIEWFAPIQNHNIPKIDYKSSTRSNGEVRRISVASQSNRTICFSTELINQRPVHYIEIEPCAVAEFSDFSINNFCIDIFSFQVDKLERDTICLLICNELDECNEIEIILEVRRPLQIPFFEDFAYEGPYPDTIKWIDNYVFVNNTFGYRPPSIGVATFDGLDESGSPYKGDRGRADYLTSTFFDLSTYRQSDDVYLTFFTQAKGLGNRPKEADSLILEFRNADGIWKKISDYTGLSDNYPIRQSPEFSFRFLKLVDQYLHREFQFRFVNVNSRTGLTELWHVDYIRLTHGFIPNGHNTDIAFTALPASFLAPYTAMPMSHFVLDKEKYINPLLPIELHNHFNSLAIAEPSRFILKELIHNHIITDDLTLLEVPPVVPQNQRNLAPGYHMFVNDLRTGTWLNNFLIWSENKDSLKIETTYSYEQDQERNSGFAELLRNNTVKRLTHIKDYFAYDDGSAELGIAIRSTPGTLSELVVKYTAEKPGHLNSIFFNFPHLDTDVSNQIFNIKVYIGTLKDTADYTDILKRPIFADRYIAGFNGFSGYAILDQETLEPSTLFIPPGDFYVGIQQVNITDNPIPIGFDRNATGGTNFIRVKLGGNWQNYSSLPNRIDGSVMIRPVVNDDEVVSTDPEIINSDFIIYPNPTSGLVNMYSANQINNGSIELFDMMGKRVFQGNLQPTINFDFLQSGMYFVRISILDTQAIYTHKLIIQK